ncbi:MAG TPA: hypothetical protein VF529_10545 [Solirubrobacteraceae bacterium]|jgi:uncharacterized repeat protein (TIGR01451 family)
MTHRLRTLAALAAAGAVGPAAGAEAAEPLLTIGVEPTAATTEQATYELLVVNHGTGDAEGVSVDTTVPQNTTLVAADPASGAPCAAGAPASTACGWQLGTIPAGASRTITLVYALTDGTYTVNTDATVSAANADDDTNSDTSLHRGVFTASDDTWVDSDEAAGTNHGACDELRVGSGRSTFLEADNARDALFSAGVATTVLHAELKAQLKTPGAGQSIAAHRLDTGPWDEGAGDCTGAAGSGSQPRTGDVPTAAGAATDTAAAPAVAGPVRWDVTADFETQAERRSFAGWELRAAGALAMHSSEVAGQEPSLTVVYRNKIAAEACVDVFAEDATAGSDQAQRLEGRITDSGARVGNGETEACSGTPFAGGELHWRLYDAGDAPDGWFATVEGVPRLLTLGEGGAGGPNVVATSSDADGRSSVEVRLAHPYADGENEGTHRIDVIVAAKAAAKAGGYGTTDPDDPSCTPFDTCEAENTQEDDVRRTWTPAPAPPETGNGSGGGSGGAPITTPPIPPPGGQAPPAAPVSRAVALTASSRLARAGRTVQLRGRVASVAGPCAGPREYVQILRRRAGRRTFTDFASVETAADGTFALPLRVDASADYLAVVTASDGCLRAASTPLRIAARPRLVVKAKHRRGRGYRIAGRVIPAARGVATLQRRARGRWVRAKRDRTGTNGRFSFTVRSLPRTWRVRWSPAARGELGATVTRRRR